MKNRKVWAILVAVGVLSVFAPAIEADVAPNRTDEETRFVPAIPDPASQRCAKIGGISRAVDAVEWGGASLGLCRLDDDSLVAEWTLFRAAFGDMNQAVSAFLAGRWIPMTGPIESWAEQACEAAGGVVANYKVHLRPDSAVRLCEFADASSIEVWTLFSGPEFYPGLAGALAPTSSSGVVFRPCPWPRTCMAPCIEEAPPNVFCLLPEDSVKMTTFACCCCGSGINSYAPLP